MAKKEKLANGEIGVAQRYDPLKSRDRCRSDQWHQFLARKVKVLVLFELLLHSYQTFVDRKEVGSPFGIVASIEFEPLYALIIPHRYFCVIIFHS